MSDKLFVMHRGDDEAHMAFVYGQDLLNDLDTGVYEGYRFLTEGDLSSLTLEYFPSYSMLILDGTAIIPKAVREVVRYTF